MLVTKYAKGREKFVQFTGLLYNGTLFLILLSCSPDINECLEVGVETIPPAFADIYLTNSANLTCRISNIPPGSEYSKLNVTWTRAKDHKQLHTVMTNFLDQVNDFYYVDAIATVCATEWNEKETYNCKVTFEDVLVKPVEKPLKKESGKFLVWLIHEKHLWREVTCSRRINLVDLVEPEALVHPSGYPQIVLLQLPALTSP